MKNVLILFGLMVLTSSVFPVPKKKKCESSLLIKAYNNGKVVYKTETNSWKNYCVDMVRVFNNKEYVTDSITYEIIYK